MPSALAAELAQNTAALSMVLSSLAGLSEEHHRAAIAVNEARLQAILDRREELLKTLEKLLRSRQQWRAAVQQLADGASEKADLLAHLANDDAMLCEKGRQVQRLMQEAEAALRSALRAISVQLQAQQQREHLRHVYHPSVPPMARFVDRMNVP